MNSSAPKTLLIVDDEPDVRELILDDLQPFEVRLLTAANGEEAWKILQSETVDAVLSDIRMPVLDGLSLVERMRQFGSITPVLFLTAYSEKEYLTAAMRLCVTDFLTKPYDYDVLVRQVSYVLELGVRLRGISLEAREQKPQSPDLARKQIQVLHVLNEINHMDVMLPRKVKSSAA